MRVLSTFTLLIILLFFIIVHISPSVYGQGSTDLGITDTSTDTPTDTSTDTPTDTPTDISTPQPIVAPNPTASLPPNPNPTTDGTTATGADIANIDDTGNGTYNSNPGVNATVPKATDPPPGTSDDPFPFVGFNQSTIELNRQNMQNSDRMLQDTLFYLHYRAREYAFSSSRGAVFAVTTKQELAPSNDSHDYLSLARYFWPNNTAINGLPYIRRDGFINPEIKLAPDYENFRSMVTALKDLSFGYYYFGDEGFAAKGVSHIQNWFINVDTRMNPHLQYASLVRGFGTGRAKGIIDWHVIVDLFNTISILQSSASWKPGMNAYLRQWFSQYRDWLWQSPNGQFEFSSLNNHGTYYDIHYSSILLFLGQTDEAKAFLQNCTRRIDIQILSTGQQPYETARPFSFFYSGFNIIGLFGLANLASDVGIDLYHYENPSGGSIQKALDYIFPYIPDTFTTTNLNWPHPNTGNFNVTYDLVAILDQAYTIYGDAKYLNKAQVVSKTWSHTSNVTRLTLPWTQFGGTMTSIQSDGESKYGGLAFATVYVLMATVVVSLVSW